MKQALVIGISLLFLSACGESQDSASCNAAITAETTGYLTSKDCQPLSWASLPIVLAKDLSLPSELSIAMDEAIQIWEVNTGINLFEINEGSLNTIGIRSGETWLAEPISGKPEEPAKTVYLYRSNQLIDSDIFFNEGFLFSLNGTADTFDATTICLHELGHLLGLDHDNSASPEMSVMNPRIQKNEVRHLSERDIERVRRLYGF
ncbi:MAG: matrixin family metalloprotease [Deltaproteobacteria bacterium]